MKKNKAWAKHIWAAICGKPIYYPYESNGDGTSNNEPLFYPKFEPYNNSINEKTLQLRAEQIAAQVRDFVRDSRSIGKDTRGIYTNVGNVVIFTGEPEH